MGISNHGLHCQHGLFLEAGRDYTGYTYLRATAGAASQGDALEVEVTLEDSRSHRVLATQTLRVPYGAEWSKLALRLHTKFAAGCAGVERLAQCSGALVIAVRPGAQSAS